MWLNECNMFQIKCYTVLVMYTFALQPIVGAKNKTIDPQNFTAHKYFEIKCSAESTPIKLHC